MSSSSFWRKLSRLVWDGSAPLTRRRAPTRSAAARKTRLLVEALEDRFAPAILTVTVPGDPLVATTGTLRWAIGQANSIPGSTINFAINDSIQLAPTPVGNGEFVISAPMTITGAGHTVTISGQNLTRIFDITPATGSTAGYAVNFDYLTMENGLASATSAHGNNGGAINASVSALNAITLLNDKVLDNNATGNGGAVYTLGSLGIYNSLLDGNNAGGNGGAVWTSRALVIDSSTLTDNTATNGGAVYQDGTTPVVITGNSSQTLFQDNTAAVNGGAAWAEFNLQAANTNFNSNTATAGSGGAIFSALGNVTLSSNTLVSNNFAGLNGGGVAANRNITSLTSWITANQAFGGNGGGLFSTKGNVIINGGAVGLLSASSVGTGITLPSGLVFGGNTAGNPSAAPVVGVGFGGGIDSGADIFVTNCAFIEGNLALADGGGTWANGNTTITTAFVDTNTAEGSGGGISTGASAGSTVELLGAFVYGNTAAGNTGSGSGNGGGVNTPNGNIYTQQSAIFLNVAAGQGGGLYDNTGAINLYDPTVIDRNTATGGGGGVYIGAGGVLTMMPAGATMFGTSVSFLPPANCNPAIAAYITTGSPTTSPNLVNNPNTIIVSNNLSGAGGGGIDAEGSEGVTILNAWIFGNTASSATGCGGGVLVHNVQNVVVSYSTISGNSSQSACGGGFAAILDRGSGVEGSFSVSFDDDTFGGSATHPNKAATAGGGVYLEGYDAFFNHVTFNDNQVGSRVSGGGAAIFADQRSNAFLENVLLDDTNNVAHASLLGTSTGMNAGVISSMGHNLSSDNSLLSVVNFNSFNGDIANGVQGLTPLAYHGGFTPTYNLLAGGQAIGDGDEVGPILDQNNVNRPVGSPSDVGSVQH